MSYKIYIIPAWYPQNIDDVTACFFREQAQALAERDHKVTVIHIEPASVTRVGRVHWHAHRFWQDGNVRTFFHKVVIPIPSKTGKLQDWYIARVYSRIISKQIEEDINAGLGVPDFLHAHVSHSCAYYCLNAAKRLRMPLVVTEHYSGLLNDYASAGDCARVKQTILRSNAFIFVGSNFQRTVCKKLHIDKPTLVIPNMVNVEGMQLKRDTISKPFVFLTACHLTKNKNVARVIEAFHQEFSSSEEVALIVAGDGEIRTSLEALAAKYEETSRIHFLGRYSAIDKQAVFHQGNAFILPSIVETFGIVFIEALACGLPCIGTRGQGSDDIIDESNGLQVRAEDVNDIAQAMRSIYENRKAYLGSSIRETCLAKFSPTAICEKLEKVYFEITGR